MRYLVCFLAAFLSFTNYSCAEDYIVGQGDVLEIAVWGIPEMSKVVSVRPDGKITLPAVGDVVASGKSPKVLGEYLSSEMENYIKKPIVTVSVQKILNNRVYITGGGISRVFDMVKQTSLLKLLSELGDLGGVDLRHAYLYRDGEIRQRDFYSLYYEGDINKDISLSAEDIIFIPSNRLNQIYVMGAVASPNRLQFYEGMKVLDAILACGGFSEFAKQDSVVVINSQGEKRKINLEHVSRGKDIKSNVALSPGDYVVVEESLF